MRLLLVLALLIVPSVAKATTYYVSGSTGSDSNSCVQAQSTSTPKLTIDAGVACLSANGGDFLYIRTGTYLNAANAIGNPQGGKSWADANTIAAYGGPVGRVAGPDGPSALAEVVTIRPPNGEASITLGTPNQKYLIFSDLIFDGVLTSGSNNNPAGGDKFTSNVYIYGGAHHTRFLRNKFMQAQSNGVHLTDTSGTMNSPFHEFLDNDFTTWGFVHSQQNTGYAIYFYTSDNLIDGNTFHTGNGTGVTLYGSPNGTRNIVSRNLFYDIGDMVYFPSTSYCLQFAAGADNFAINNVCHSSRGGIAFGAPFNGVPSGFSNGTGSGTVYAYHNTVYNNDYVEGGVAVTRSCRDCQIKNNISWGHTYGDVVNRGINTTFQSNLFGSASVANYESGTFISTSNQFSAAHGLTNVGALDFRPLATSTAVNAAAPLAAVTTDYVGTTRPQGGTSDIGAYEFVSSIITPPTPPPSVPVDPVTTHVTTIAGLRAAVASAILKVGDTITLVGGGSPTTYDTAGTPLDLPPMPNGVCDGTTFTTIRTDQAADIPADGTQVVAAQWARFPRIISSTNAAAVVRVNGNGDCWKIQGVRIESTYTGGVGSANVLAIGVDVNGNPMTDSADNPRFFVGRHLYIACAWSGSGGCVRGILGNGSGAIHDSVVKNIVSNSVQSAGFGAWNTEGPWRLQNSEFEASGQGILIGGADPAIGVDKRPRNLTFLEVWAHKNTTWQANNPADFINCNGIEFKNAEDVLLDTVLIEHSWGDCQSGGGLLVTSLNDTGKCVGCTIKRVAVKNTVIRHVGIGVVIAGQGGYNRSDYSACNVAGPGNNVTDGYVETGQTNLIKSVTANFGDSMIGLTVTLSGGSAGLAPTTRNIVNPWGTLTTTGGISGATTMPISMYVDGAALPVGTGMTMTFQSHTVNSANAGCALSTRVEDISLDNVLMYDITTAWWNQIYGAVQFSTRPIRTSFNHVTAVTAKPVYWTFADASAAATTSTGLSVTNSFFVSSTYGIRSDSDGNNKTALDAWFPSGYTWEKNVVAPNGMTLPAGNYAQLTEAAALAQFTLTTPGSENFQLITASPYRLLGTDGKDIGVTDWTKIYAAMSLATPGHVSGTIITPPVTPVEPPIVPPDPPPAPNVLPVDRPVRFPRLRVCNDALAGPLTVIEGVHPVALCHNGIGVTSWTKVINGKKSGIALQADGISEDGALTRYVGVLNLTPGRYAIAFAPKYGTLGDGPLSRPFSVTVIRRSVVQTAPVGGRIE